MSWPASPWDGRGSPSRRWPSAAGSCASVRRSRSPSGPPTRKSAPSTPSTPDVVPPPPRARSRSRPRGLAAVAEGYLPPVHGDHSPIIEAVGVRKEFDGVAALDGVNVQIPRGCLVGLIGPSGCGKTTLIRTLTGVVAPDEGEICV